MHIADRNGVDHAGFAVVGFLGELDMDAAIHEIADFERETGGDFARDTKAGLNRVVVLVIGREVEDDAAVAARTRSDTEQTEFGSSYFSERAVCLPARPMPQRVGTVGLVALNCSATWLMYLPLSPNRLTR